MAVFRSPRLAPSILTYPACFHHSLSRRGFASTKRNRVSITDLVLSGPTAFIDIIHNSGIPYYAAIPLTALIVRSTVVYYLAVRPARRQARLVHSLRPLIDAKSVLLRATEGKKFREANREMLVADSSRVAQQRVQIRWRMKYWWMRFQTQVGYLRIFGTGWRPWGLLNFGILIAFTESIRLKCGRSEGLLSLLLTPVEKVLKMENPLKSGKGQPIDHAQVLADKLQAIYDANLAEMRSAGLPDAQINSIVSDPGYAQKLASMPTPTEPSPYFDPAMQVEGFDFCLDLTQADPTGRLPVMAGLILFTTVLFRSKAGARPKVTQSSQPSTGDSKPEQHPEPDAIAKPGFWPSSMTNLERIGLVFAMFFAALIQNFPAGIVLYLGPHFLVGWLQRHWLDRRDPMPKPIMGCKRRLLFDSKKDL